MNSWLAVLELLQVSPEQWRNSTVEASGKFIGSSMGRSSTKVLFLFNKSLRNVRTNAVMIIECIVIDFLVTIN